MDPVAPSTGTFVSIRHTVVNDPSSASSEGLQRELDPDRRGAAHPSSACRCSCAATRGARDVDLDIPARAAAHRLLEQTRARRARRRWRRIRSSSPRWLRARRTRSRSAAPAAAGGSPFRVLDVSASEAAGRAGAAGAGAPASQARTRRTDSWRRRVWRSGRSLRDRSSSGPRRSGRSSLPLTRRTLTDGKSDSSSFRSTFRLHFLARDDRDRDHGALDALLIPDDQLRRRPGPCHSSSISRRPGSTL